MPTYKTFLKIAKKNIPSLMIYFVIFMVISIMMTSQGAEEEKQTYKDEEINFTVINRDNSRLGEAIKEYLSEKNDYIEVEDDEEAIRLSLYYRDTYYVLIIPEGYEDAIAGGEDMECMNYKVTDTAMSYYMDMSVESYIKTLKSYIAAGYDMDNAIEKTAGTLNNSAEVSLLANMEQSQIKGNPISGEYSDENPDFYYFYQYIPYIFLAIIITGLGPIMIVFGQKDVRKRINVSAQSFKKHNIQLVLGVITFGAVVLAAFNIMAVALYGGGISLAAMIYYLILTLTFILVALSIALFGGYVFSKTATMGAFGNVVSLGFSFLGGIFVPMEFFGDTLLNIARFTPTYWYVKANNAIIGVEKFSDIDMGEFGKNLAIQLMFAAAFLLVGLAVSRHKREEA